MAASASTTPAVYFHPREDDIAVVFLDDYPFITPKVEPFEECLNRLLDALDKYRSQRGVIQTAEH